MLKKFTVFLKFFRQHAVALVNHISKSKLEEPMLKTQHVFKLSLLKFGRPKDPKVRFCIFSMVFWVTSRLICKTDGKVQNRLGGKIGSLLGRHGFA